MQLVPWQNNALVPSGSLVPVGNQTASADFGDWLTEMLAGSLEAQSPWAARLLRAGSKIIRSSGFTSTDGGETTTITNPFFPTVVYNHTERGFPRVNVDVVPFARAVPPIVYDVNRTHVAFGPFTETSSSAALRGLRTGEPYPSSRIYTYVPRDDADFLPYSFPGGVFLDHAGPVLGYSPIGHAGSRRSIHGIPGLSIPRITYNSTRSTEPAPRVPFYAGTSGTPTPVVSRFSGIQLSSRGKSSSSRQRRPRSKSFRRSSLSRRRQVPVRAHRRGWPRRRAMFLSRRRSRRSSLRALRRRARGVGVSLRTASRSRSLGALLLPSRSPSRLTPRDILLGSRGSPPVPVDYSGSRGRSASIRPAVPNWRTRALQRSQANIDRLTSMLHESPGPGAFDLGRLDPPSGDSSFLPRYADEL